MLIREIVEGLAQDLVKGAVRLAAPLAQAAKLVGGNHVYHATDAAGLKGILNSQSIRAAFGPQTATQWQTKLPTVSVTRDWNYAMGHGTNQLNNIGHDAVIVLDRDHLEQRYRTLGTSQSNDVRNSFSGNDPFQVKIKRNQIRANRNRAMADPENEYDLYTRYRAPHAGGESEEAVVVPKGSLPTDSMVGFYINPKSQLRQDPEIMADPRRLELAPGGTGRFVFANAH